MCYFFKSLKIQCPFYLERGPSCCISFLAEIPLFHVLNARITFGSVNKCSTEAEVKTTPAVTPTSTAGDEEAAGGAATGYTPSFHICKCFS